MLPDSYSVLLMPVLLSCIPESWTLEWLRGKSDSDEMPAFLKFLQREMTIRDEASTRKRAGVGVSDQENQPSATKGSRLSAC